MHLQANHMFFKCISRPAMQHCSRAGSESNDKTHCSPTVRIKSVNYITLMAQMFLYVVNVWEETGVPGENPRAWTGDHVP